MGQFLIEHIVDGETEIDVELAVSDLQAAREALVQDLHDTAAEDWGAEVLRRWDEHPGYAHMLENPGAVQEHAWTFRFVE